MKNLQLERENIGIELYGVQQQLAKQQMLVEAEQDKHTVMSQLSAQKTATLNQVREFHQTIIQQVKGQRQQSKCLTNYNNNYYFLFITANELRGEVENAVARLRYITEAHQTVKDDIALTKRATEKTTSDVSRAEREKLKQVS